MSSIKSDQLEKIIREIIELINKFPEKYQPILLNVLLRDSLEMSRKSIFPETQVVAPDEISEFIIPIDVRAFLIQYDLSEKIIHQLYLIEKNQITQLWRLKTTKKSLAQIQIALLNAFENALQIGKFEFSYEEVRNRCKEEMVYDSINYSTIFRTYSDYFKSFDDKEHIALSPDGKEALANAMLELARDE